VERILEELKIKNKFKDELCKYINVPNPVISMWISGKTKSYTKYIDKISEFLDVSADYLLGKTDVKTRKITSDDDPYIAFYEGFKDMNEQDKQILIATYRAIQQKNKNK
jgi:transcriptional regulator with XRE-family HTH domain